MPTRRLVALAAAALIGVALTGCATDGSLDNTLASPGDQSGSDFTARARSGVDAGAVYKRAAPSTFSVIANTTNTPGKATGIGLGSAFLIDRKGDVATAAHVILDEIDHSVAKSVLLQAENGERFPASIVAYDPHADVAVLRSAELASEKSLKPLQWESRRPLIGDPSVAIGTPLGISFSMAVGFITGLDRTISGLAGFDIYGAVQTDTPITLGNSGGPLLNSDAQVIGINDQIASVGGGGEGLGFVVPAKLARKSAAALIATGHVGYAYLGLRSKPVWRGLHEQVSNLPNLPGVLVGAIKSDSPAERAGLQAGHDNVVIDESRFQTGGDFITAVGDHRLKWNENLNQVLADFQPNDVTTITYYRGGQRQTTKVKFDDRPRFWPSPLKGLFG